MKCSSEVFSMPPPPPEPPKGSGSDVEPVFPFLPSEEDCVGDPPPSQDREVEDEEDDIPRSGHLGG